MKKLNKLKKITKAVGFLLAILVVFQNCSKKDDDVSKATVTYENNTIEATFYNSGNSVPIVDWNGNRGTFSLVESYADGIDGLTINESTGEIRWTKLLKEGIWIFDVEATNSAGTTIIEMTIDNTLQGVFTGTYGLTEFYEIEFFKDGTAEVRANNPADPDIGTGTWTINNEYEVLVDYAYQSNQYSTLGTLIQTNSNAFYSGNWYHGYGAADANEGGVFETVLVN